MRGGRDGEFLARGGHRGGVRVDHLRDHLRAALARVHRRRNHRRGGRRRARLRPLSQTILRLQKCHSLTRTLGDKLGRE